MEDGGEGRANTALKEDEKTKIRKSENEKEMTKMRAEEDNRQKLKSEQSVRAK